MPRVARAQASSNGSCSPCASARSPERVQNSRTLTDRVCQKLAASSLSPAVARAALDAGCSSNSSRGHLCLRSETPATDRATLRRRLEQHPVQAYTAHLLPAPRAQRRVIITRNEGYSRTPATAGQPLAETKYGHRRASARPAARRRGSLVREGRHYYGLRFHRPARRQLARDVGRADGRAPVCT